MKPHAPIRLRAVLASLGLALFPAVALAAALANPPICANSGRRPLPQRVLPAVRPAPDSGRIAASYGKLPLAFEANRGQADPRARFLAHGPGYMLALTPTGAVLSLSPRSHAATEKRSRSEIADDRRWTQMGRKGVGDRSPRGSRVARSTRSGVSSDLLHLRRPSSASIGGPKSVLRMQLVGANPAAEVVGAEPLPGKSNYFIGNDPGKWRTNVPQYSRVRCKDVYPGIDLVYYGNQRQMEYDFVVAPEADPGVIRLAFQGTSHIDVDAKGDLVLHIAAGEVRQHRPQIYQEIDGVRHPVAGGYVLARDVRGVRGEKSPTQVAFRLGPHDRSRPLVIDPQLVYSTYLGGSGIDTATGIAADAGGNAYVTGYTASADFPTANPIQGNPAGGTYDVYVTKLDASGSSLVYSTYLGGSSFDFAGGIAVDATGNACIAGLTVSSDFPTVNALQAGNAGSNDAYVAKLDPSGSSLIYSTYLGGGDIDDAAAVALDASGNAYIGGHTYSANFPTVNPLQATRRGEADAFVAKVSSSGSTLVYSTYLGGSLNDNGDNRVLGPVYGIAVDAAGSAYVAGTTNAVDFPTVNALQSSSGGRQDAFVAKLSPAGSVLVYSTYLGGSDGDSVGGIAVDAAGSAYFAGATPSSDFPMANAMQPNLGGNGDAFVTKLSSAGSSLVYSTYLGGSSGEVAFAIAIDAAGNAYVAGGTSSNDFPTVSPLQPSNAGSGDGFVAELNPQGSALVYSTYLGGTGGDQAQALAVDAAGNAYVAGGTLSSDFPTVNPVQATPGGGQLDDAFIAKIGQPAAPTFTISGAVHLGSAGLAGVTVAASTQSAVTAADGTYRIGNLTAGTYTVTPSLAEYTFAPASASVTVGPDQSGVDFTAARNTYSVSGTVRLGNSGMAGVTVSTGGQRAVTDARGQYQISGLISGRYAVAAMLAGYAFAPSSVSVTLGPSRSGVDFAAASGPYTISGTVRAGQSGLAGVTVTAGAASAVTGANGAYAISGLSAGTYTVTPSLAEYTFTPTSASVTVGPSRSGVDFTATRVTYSISGTVRLGAAGLAGATVSAGGHSVVTDAKGQYQIVGLISGGYTVTPSLAEYSFSPESAQVTLGPSRSGVDFAATRTGYTISGTVREGQNGLAGVTVSAGGQTAITDGAGKYQIAGLISGRYTVVPALAEYTFSPPSALVTLGPSRSGVDFTATRATYSISGTVRLGSAGIAGVAVSAGGKSATTDGNGNYQISALISGSYAVTPSRAEYTFSPPSRLVTLGPSQPGVDFTASPITYTVSGTVREKFKPLAGAAVSLNGQTVITGSSGAYQFTGVISGNYTVSVSKHEYTFAPSSVNITLGPSRGGIDFTGVPSVPVPPSNLVAVAPSAMSVQLTWQDNSDNETGFKVERALPPNGQLGAFTQIAILPAGTTSYVDASVSGSASYMYRVQATNGGGDSAPSNVASVTVPAGVLSVTLAPNSVRGGGSLKGTVTLTGPAPAGAKVVLSVSNGRFAAVKPKSVTVQKGKRRASFTVSTRRVIATTPVTVSASYHGSTASNVLLINP